MLTVTKEFEFDSAHSLKDGYVGPCARVHGHRYKLAVTLAGVANSTLNEFGMLMDFTDLKKIWSEKIEPLFDHQFLNDTLNMQTTAENMSVFLFQKFSEEVNNNRVKVIRIELWETPTSKATFEINNIASYLSETFIK